MFNMTKAPDKALFCCFVTMSVFACHITCLFVTKNLKKYLKHSKLYIVLCFWKYYMTSNTKRKGDYYEEDKTSG